MPRFRRLDFASCFAEGGPFSRKALPGGGRAYLRAEADSQALREAVAGVERLLETPLKTLKDSRSAKAVIAEAPGIGRVFVKRHNNRGLRYALRYLFRRARAFRAWQAAWLLEQLGVPTPRTLAAIAFRQTFILQGSYLIQEEIPDMVHPAEAVAALAKRPDAFAAFLADALKHLSLMHDCGITHGDLKFSNIYCKAASDGQPAFAGFIDLDAIRARKRSLPDSLRIAELSRLASSFLIISAQQGCAVEREKTAGLIADAYESSGGPPQSKERLLESVMQWMDKR